MSGVELDVILRRLLSAPARVRRDALEAAQAVIEGLPPLAVSQSQVARMLNLSRHTVMRLERDGVLKSVSFRGAKRYPVAELQAFLAGTVPPAIQKTENRKWR